MLDAASLDRDLRDVAAALGSPFRPPPSDGGMHDRPFDWCSRTAGVRRAATARNPTHWPAGSHPTWPGSPTPVCRPSGRC